MRYKDIAVSLVEIISIALTAYLIRVTLGVWKLIHGKTEETVASPASVPLHFALGIFWLPLVVQILAWGVHFYDSALASATLAAATAVTGAVTLVAILRPQRIAMTIQTWRSLVTANTKRIWMTRKTRMTKRGWMAKRI